MKIPHGLLLLTALLLTGCQQQVLYSDLTEYEANEMIAVLFAGNIPAKKDSVKGQGKKGPSYDVTIEASALPQATALLKANGLPRQRFASIPDMFPKTMLQSPVEQMARLKHGLAQEMAKTLSTIDGVSAARVHLTLPDRQVGSGAAGLSDKPGSSAAVFIKHRSDIDLQGSVTKIKALVVDGVENMSYDDVTVVFFAEKPIVIPAMMKSTDEKLPVLAASMSSPFAVWLLLAIAALVGFGFIVGKIVQSFLIRSQNGKTTKAPTQR